MSIASPERPLIFGEILFDSFPDGSRVLGGAPFNVAWHLQGFGATPLFISRIGRDAPGEEVRALMSAWRMDMTGIQLDDRHPTGLVQIKLHEGQPEYTIVPEQAYDFIDAAAALYASSSLKPALLYHGTLALRHPASRDAWTQLCSATAAPRCVDINLRAPWWDPGLVEDVLHGAAWAKLNDEELLALTGEDASRLQQAAQDLRCRYRLPLLIVTRGASGAMLLTDEALLEEAPLAVSGVVDTVGAGDAFSAVALLGMLRGWSLLDTLQRALEFAARICTIRGATVQDDALYHDYLSRWGEEQLAD